MSRLALRTFFAGGLTPKKLQKNFRITAREAQTGLCPKRLQVWKKSPAFPSGGRFPNRKYSQQKDSLFPPASSGSNWPDSWRFLNLSRRFPAIQLNPSILIYTLFANLTLCYLPHYTTAICVSDLRKKNIHHKTEACL